MLWLLDLTWSSNATEWSDTVGPNSSTVMWHYWQQLLATQMRNGWWQFFLPSKHNFSYIGHNIKCLIYNIYCYSDARHRPLQTSSRCCMCTSHYWVQTMTWKPSLSHLDLQIRSFPDLQLSSVPPKKKKTLKKLLVPIFIKLIYNSPAADAVLLQGFVWESDKMLINLTYIHRALWVQHELNVGEKQQYQKIHDVFLFRLPSFNKKLCFLFLW